MSISVSDVTIQLRPLQTSDLELLESWLLEPHVSPWYARPAEDLAWAADPPAGGNQAIIVADDQDVGYLRWQRVDRATLDSIGLDDIPENSVDADIILGAGGLGRSVGSSALEALVSELRRDPSVPLIGLTTELANTRAHRAFERAGFRKDRQYDAPPLGRCHLMLRDLRLG
jgi:aminoglycoside 6'-N-acetyltransferase